MLQVFYQDVAHVCNDFEVFSGVFASVSDICCKCFRSFGRMLQVLHLDVAKVDIVFSHLLQAAGALLSWRIHMGEERGGDTRGQASVEVTWGRATRAPACRSGCPV
jgi:hypothetical protein